MKKESATSIPPEYFESGAIGRQTGTVDRREEVPESVERIVLDNFVELLPEWYKSSVQMTVMAGLTYREAAERISNLRHKQTDKKTVWRWTEKGVLMLKSWLMESPWVGAITQGKIPVEYLDASKGISIPGMSDASE